MKQIAKEHIRHTNMRASLALTAVAAALALCAAWAAAGATPMPMLLKHGDVLYDMQPLPTAQRRIRVAFTGSNFTLHTQFRLSSTARCGNGNPLALTDTLTQPVAWTEYDTKTSFVGSFIASNESAVVYACVSYNRGRSWFMAKNQRGRTHFRLWGKVPTARVVPSAPVAFKPLTVYVKNLPAGSRAVLSSDPKGCDALVPMGVIRGGNATTMAVVDATTGSFAFRPRVSAAAVYVCVATPPTLNDWTLAPVDQNDVMVYRRGTLGNAQAPSDTVTGSITNRFFTLYSGVNSFRRAQFGCDTPFVQGRTSRCYVSVVNRTLLTIAAADVRFMTLVDGAGVAECPFPTLVQFNATTAYFDWTPQRWGRSGSISMSYLNVPLPMGSPVVAQSASGLAKPNATGFPLGGLDPQVALFVVLPGDADSVDYGLATNLLTDIDSFAPILPNFAITRGIPDSTSNSTLLGGEPLYMTLSRTATTALTSRTVTGVAARSRCRFAVKYAFFPDTGDFDQTRTSLVGSASITSRTAGGVDIAALKSFFVYAQGQATVVTGNDVIPLGVTGEVRTTEALSFEFPWDAEQAGFRVQLSIFHAQQRRFYWSEPELRCVASTDGGPTLPADVAAVQSIYTALVGGQANLRTWRNRLNTGFNGDPCRSKWQGVICRNQRIVELQLSGLKLNGPLDTAVGSLSALEELRVADNSFYGAMPASLSALTRLRIIDAARNKFSSVPATLASSTTNTCLRSIFAQHNLIAAFPTQTQLSPSLASLRLEWNAMTGTLPAYASTTVPLRELSVAHNKLSGALPTALPFQSLIVADLSDNAFTGAIPSAWSGFQNLQYLDVSHNQLQQAVPAALGQIRSGNQLTFRAQDNYLSGLVPRLPFESYDLRQNIIACPLPTTNDFESAFQLKGLRYDTCDYASAVNVYFSPY